MIRTFVAISISDEARSAIFFLIDKLKKIESSIRWVDPSNLHLTLKFIGEIEKNRQKNLVEALDLSVKDISAFQYELSGKGCFPNCKQSRVLWIGVNDLKEKMSALQKQIDNNFYSVQIPRENRNFKPHLTIGRVKQNRKPGTILSKFEQFQLGEFVVDVGEVYLMKSELLPTGAKYSILHSASLTASNSEFMDKS
ncbi:RNA 2',3'-cyclic phosphodiesterase [candidate division KSB1 bacterium]|nr:RNA 2',3'-cyclic phosphodiesterase [candidate division KSB1 bacterium]